ncbi:zeta-crystallin [Salpingoeca rosetta]|uniref:Zeta-crystallin n=1 Tax=Salpingoeca rosetta (strain ATCC 50818 / BSB-021) TaxID=946362 RepID=F2U3N6_SALR5|nr:zeta-crystallin [Salpingoeca rosetta]EGD82230.1 zeta-crystallin [Salpingoeca rosetta]|eukprot:XP_004996413.1 zeta-crystallin [Salpingoeca rosetta]
MWGSRSNSGELGEGSDEPVMMKAGVVRAFGPPAALKVESVPIPSLSEPNEVLTKVFATGVNPVDTYIRAGKYAKLPQLPYTPGAEGAGVVAKVGADVKHVKVGDRVYVTGTITGTYAQYSLCAARDVRLLPQRISFAQGAAVSVAYRTAYRALFQKSSPNPGETVLIHGASGGVGLAAVQLAVSRGLKVFGTASTDVGKEAILEHGAAAVFDHTSPTYVQEIQRAAPPEGIRLIVEMLANINLNNDLKVSCGTREEWEAAYCAIDAGMSSGALVPHVGKTFPLDDAATAHIDVMEHVGGAHGKLVLLPWPEETAEDVVCL